MKQQIYQCKECDFTTHNPSLIANHVLWTHKPRGEKGKYQRKLSCIECKMECSTQNFESHFKSKHTTKLPKSYCI